MAYGNYMPMDQCSYCPYMAGGYVQQNSAMGEYRDDVKGAPDVINTYDSSQYRVLPLLTLPLLFAAAGPRPFYGPGPFWGPPPFSYNYWYYYYR